MARHQLDRRKIKGKRNYTVEEAARVIGATKGTVRRWLARGLPAIRDRKPFLILGADLADFMVAKTRSKGRCPSGTCFCVKCRTARSPAGDMAEFLADKAKSGNLRALCPECGSLMHRRTSYAQLEVLRRFLDVTIVELSTRLVGSEPRSTNEYLRQEREAHA